MLNFRMQNEVLPRGICHSEDFVGTKLDMTCSAKVARRSCKSPEVKFHKILKIFSISDSCPKMVNLDPKMDFLLQQNIAYLPYRYDCKLNLIESVSDIE